MVIRLNQRSEAALATTLVAAPDTFNEGCEAPGGTDTQEVPPRAAEWQRLRLLNFSVSTLSELYIENRERGEFFPYIFVGITCGSSGRCTWNSSL